jgi:hypothetical protein
VQSGSRRLQIRPCWLSYNHWTGMSMTVYSGLIRTHAW